jgi:DNA-binding SARP family transcriptional activator/tetratricopeptide (TPR) repeat protein
MRADHRLERTRLIERVRGRPAAFVVAPGGYGKTTLATQLAQAVDGRIVTVVVPEDPAPDLLLVALRRAFARAGMSRAALEDADDVDAAAAAVTSVLAHEEHPLVVLVDEVQRAGPGALALVGALLASATPPHHVILAGRRLPGGLDPGDPAAVATVDADALAFTPNEVADLVAAHRGRDDPDLAAALTTATAGWPAAVAMGAARGALPGAGASRGPSDALADLVAAVVDGLPGDARGVLGEVAGLPLLAPEVIDAVGGPGTWDAPIDGGLPLVPAGGRWSRIGDPVVERLGVRAPGAATATLVAPVYTVHGALLEAVELVLATHGPGAACALVESFGTERVEQLTPVEWRVLLALLGPEADRHPALLVQVARALEVTVHVGERTALLDRAAASCAKRGDDAGARAVDAERVRDLARDGEEAAARDLAGGVLEATARAGDELATRARCLAGLGRAESWARRPERAGELLGEAATLAERLGERGWSSQASLWLGYGVWYAEGDVDRAVDAVRRGVALLTVGSRRRAVAAVLAGEVLTGFGLVDEAAALLDEARRTGARLGDERLLGYAHWLAAEHAALAGDRQGVLAQLALAERHPGDWFGHPTGIMFLAQGADQCRRVGLVDEARAYLARAVERARAVELDEITLLAEGAHEAAHGDAARAEDLLARAIDSPELEPRDRWCVHLHRAVAARRRDDIDTCSKHAARAMGEARGLGLADLVARREPAATASLADVMDPGGPSRASGSPVTTVHVLGTFAVERDGAVVTPVGQSGQLVKLLAVHDGALPVEVAIDVLWPDADLDTGRRRLRNLLNRLREQSGELVVRRDDSLVFAVGADVDLTRFEALTRAAASGGDGAVAAARSAVGLYAGELLPADRYDDWVVAPRERARQRAVAALDALTVAAEGDGDHSGALAWAERALALAPLDEDRSVRAARHALALGRRDHAARLLDRCRSGLAELGLDPGPDHRTLEDQLRR